MSPRRHRRPSLPPQVGMIVDLICKQTTSSSCSLTRAAASEYAGIEVENKTFLSGNLHANFSTDLFAMRVLFARQTLDLMTLTGIDRYVRVLGIYARVGGL